MAIWQETHKGNVQWKTNRPIRCDFCDATTDRVYHIKLQDKKEEYFACHHCLDDAMEFAFRNSADEFIYMRHLMQVDEEIIPRRKKHGAKHTKHR